MSAGELQRNLEKAKKQAASGTKYLLDVRASPLPALAEPHSQAGAGSGGAEAGGQRAGQVRAAQPLLRRRESRASSGGSVGLAVNSD